MDYEYTEPEKQLGRLALSLVAAYRTGDPDTWALVWNSMDEIEKVQAAASLSEMFVTMLEHFAKFFEGDVDDLLQSWGQDFAET